MATDSYSKPSFSPYRKWGIGLHVCLLVLVVLSVLVMVNYVSRDYFLRFHTSTRTKIELSPRTIGLLKSLTNQVKVTLYYDTVDKHSLYSTVADLLNEYRLVNPRITVQTVDYIRDTGLAQSVKGKYDINSPTDKNLVIFDCDHRWKKIDGNGLAQYVIEHVTGQAADGKGPSLIRKPTAFLGELAFTAALLDVTSTKPLNAYFLQGHGEHQISSGDDQLGYLKFASILQQNNIRSAPLSLLIRAADCWPCLILARSPRTPDSKEF
ncbi:MAG: Gldg family protein [Verrucomicrobia bacterium]|nr:Gldg family protein [Verrucomicrobiota bacterium]